MNRGSIGIAAAFAVLVATTTVVRDVAERSTRAQVPDRVAALPAIPFLEVASLGFRPAMADVAWLQAVQYYGEHRQGGNDLSEFQHYVEVVNTLDPRYEYAHVFGAFVVATEQHDLDGALAILRRGARANPESPECLFEMGFLIYVQGGDLDEALHYLRLSARRPGGRDRATRFMAFLNRRLGRDETAWLLWKEIRDNAHDPGMRAVAAKSMRQIESRLRGAAQQKGTTP